MDAALLQGMGVGSVCLSLHSSPVAPLPALRALCGAVGKKRCTQLGITWGWDGQQEPTLPFGLHIHGAPGLGGKGLEYHPPPFMGRNISHSPGAQNPT